jgi:hypothetical protein
MAIHYRRSMGNMRGVVQRNAGEEVMGTWEFVLDVSAALAAGLLLLDLGWAALVRGRAHQIIRLHRDADFYTADHCEAGWAERLRFALFRLARRTGRFHVAVGAVAGWV